MMMCCYVSPVAKEESLVISWWFFQFLVFSPLLLFKFLGRHDFHTLTLFFLPVVSLPKILIFFGIFNHNFVTNHHQFVTRGDSRNQRRGEPEFSPSLPLPRRRRDCVVERVSPFPCDPHRCLPLSSSDSFVFVCVLSLCVTHEVWLVQSRS